MRLRMDWRGVKFDWNSGDLHPAADGRPGVGVMLSRVGDAEPLMRWQNRQWHP